MSAGLSGEIGQRMVELVGDDNSSRAKARVRLSGLIVDACEAMNIRFEDEAAVVAAAVGTLISVRACCAKHKSAALGYAIAVMTEAYVNAECEQKADEMLAGAPASRA